MTKRTLRRIFLCSAFGLISLLLAPFALVLLDLAMIATGIDDDEAVAVLPDRSQSIAVRRQPIWHPILGTEFRRSIILSNAGQQVLRIEIEPDTGGYVVIHVYDMTEGNYLLTDGLNCYQVDSPRRYVHKIPVLDRSKLTFVGAFSDDATNHHFRFVSSEQRPPQSFSYTDPDWCLNTQQ
jgi:hypothetical protein